MSISSVRTYATSLQEQIDSLEVALPPAVTTRLDQDAEWIVVNVDGDWQKIRLHDYNEVYSIPGLYEKWVYRVFGCQSPTKIAELLNRALLQAGVKPDELVTLDLGAGNGCVAEELNHIGLQKWVGVDIYPEAAEAAERDRPGLYADYFVGSMTDLGPDGEAMLGKYDFSCMTCVAALGFGDIPPAVFAAAFNRISKGGWAAFTIKTDFLNPDDQSGFSKLIRHMMREGVIELVERETYVHRMSTSGDELRYDAFVGRVHGQIPANWIDSD